MAHRIPLALIIALAVGSASALGESSAAGSRAAQLQDLAILRRDVALDRAYSDEHRARALQVIAESEARAGHWTAAEFELPLGIAVDSADGIACTATEGDWNIQFYDIATESGFEETLQGGTSDLNSGADVEFDPVNKLFLINQQVCGGQEENGCIQIYDASGNWVETANGNGFSHMALNPNTRTGFLELNDNDKFDELQSFTY